ncbi:hypothetical protein [Azohydromonas australica]|uniref:hypothetical protein n=1 Tax=Azohydromonas australica TaxID=364039 RepID=UPI0012EB0966|nr:hypothetical protein [Azohydromonas australica]
MKRLFPVNEAIIVKQTAALRIIGADLGGPLGAVYIGNGANGPAVFYEDRQGSEGTRCACDLHSSYWQQCHAKAAVAALLVRLAIDSSKGPT